MNKKLKLGIIGAVSITMMFGSAMAFSGNNIKDIKAINKELSKIEVDVYKSTQKKAVRAAEIKKLQAQVDLINNHIQMRENESQELRKAKKRIMTEGVRKIPTRCHYDNGLSLMFLLEGETCDEALERESFKNLQ